MTTLGGIRDPAWGGHLFIAPMVYAPTCPSTDYRIVWKTDVALQDLGSGFNDANAAGSVVLSKQVVATTVDENIFVADRNYKVVGFRAAPTISGTDAGAVTADVKKCTGTQAPSAGNTILAPRGSEALAVRRAVSPKSNIRC